MKLISGGSAPLARARFVRRWLPSSSSTGIPATPWPRTDAPGDAPHQDFPEVIGQIRVITVARVQQPITHLASCALRPARWRTAPLPGPLQRSASTLATPPSRNPVELVCPTIQPASLGSTPAAPRPVDKCLPSWPGQFPKPPLYSLLLEVSPSTPAARSGVPSRLPPYVRRRSTNRIESSGIPSLSHAGVSEHYPELLGFHQSPCPCLLVAPLSIPSTGVTRLLPVLGLSAPAQLVLADSRLARARHSRALIIPLARMPPPLPRRNRSVLASLASRPLSLPRISGGSAGFEACSAFTRVTPGVR